uniref:GLOBIN domain-containing protein n=1 Tax=Rhabditophanes sp. KR3021 TaxID=114890 RepID=A0AC35UGX5_9BILA
MGNGASSGSSSPNNNNGPDKSNANDAGAPQTVDSRLPFSFRELYTLKNYYKAVRRTDKECGKAMLKKYLQTSDNQKYYPKLKSIDISKLSADTVDPAYEAMAANYLKLFDEVITLVEETPADCSEAINRLKHVGRMHRKVEGLTSLMFQDLEVPFLSMLSLIV